MKKPFFFPTAKRALAFVLSALFFNLVYGQTITSFIQPANVNIGSLDSAQTAEYQKILNDSNFLNVQFVDLLNLSTEASDGKLDINIPGHGCEDLVFRSKMVRYTSENEYYWYGEVQPDEADSCSCNSGYLMLISKNLEKYGLMEIDDDDFELFDIGGQINVLVQEDSTTIGLQACGNIPSPALDDDGILADRSGCTAVDILVLYTPAADGVPGSNTSKADEGVSHFNQVLMNSLVFDFKANLVGTVGVTFTENSTNPSADVTTLATGTSIFEVTPGTRNVLQLRTDFNADIVVMMTNGNYDDHETNGIVAAIGPSNAFAYAIVEKDNIKTFAHELGHLFGCRHETCTEHPTFITGSGCDDTAGSMHAHYFKTGCVPFKQKRRTEMWSFRNGGSIGGNKIPHFSNPLVEYGKTGKQATGTSTSNNAGIIKNSACTVAGFSQSSGQSPLVAKIDGNMFVCPCKTTILEMNASGGSDGAYQYEWRTSSNGITYGGIEGTSSTFSVVTPCTEGEGLFIKSTVISTAGEEAFDVFYIESKDPPYPNMDCPVELVVNNDNTIGSVSISPNPISGKTKITYIINEPTQISLSLIDFSGIRKQVIESGWKAKGVHEKDLDMDSYNAGTYFIQLQSDENFIVEKLTKIE